MLSQPSLSPPASRDPLGGSREGKGAQVEKLYYVYMLASRRNGTLYIGVTNDLARRTWEHQSNLVDGFTKKHGVHRLVWYETYDDINDAIAREKQLKGWNRAWKIRLIEEHNSGWNNLYERING
jgi:putative endonuclease